MKDSRHSSDNLLLINLLDPSFLVPGSDPETQLRPMVPPMVTVAKSDAVIQILPSALRFWEKLGLGPRGGKKDVTAFVLFEGEGDERSQQVESWLRNVSGAYNVRDGNLLKSLNLLTHGTQDKRFGRHIAGCCSICSKDGIVPIRFDSFRKNLREIIYR